MDEDLNLFQACMKKDERAAATLVNQMPSRAQSSAIWAILMHAAAWHEERTYDTPHATILVNSIHQMIEECGPNSDLLDESYGQSPMVLPDGLRDNLQSFLIERLARYLAAVDHWGPERGPRYKIKKTGDSPDNMLHSYVQAIRERSHISALRSVIALAAQGSYTRLLRMTVTLGAERPDRLGHTFILPVSLLSELPEARFTMPHEAVLWHLTEYLVRKVPNRRPRGFDPEPDYAVRASPTSISRYGTLYKNATVRYGILGHNAIFAHRIAVAAQKGTVDSTTIHWLIEELKQNTGTNHVQDDDISVETLIEKETGTDWKESPEKILAPHSGPLKTWLDENIGDYWGAMLDKDCRSFEGRIQDIGKDEWSLVRAAQYAMAALNGHPAASHVMIFAHATWGLSDLGMIPEDLAALQTHRMLRQYLKRD
ncbi:hypothetical protein EU538_00095 [Candidatus Thorarchaeota archaeon]|nr:MAG: hypothetical protein EU538_00095 [Candidatus Thorarchaeota archaeon]